MFGSGVLLLLFPADRLLSRCVQLRSLDWFRSLENSPRYRPWWWVPMLWLDPLRAFLGVYLLKAALLAADPSWVGMNKLSYGVVVALICGSVIAQMFTRREADVLLAPLGFVAGIVAALTPWPVALIGLTMAVTAMFAFRRLYAFFGFGLAAVGILGALFKAPVAWLIPALAILFLPMVVAFLSGWTLEIPIRDDSAPRGALKR